MRYEQYDLRADAERALSYIDNMTDRAYGYLPFWLVLPHKKPAEAEHCKVDDAELVGSWFEAVDSIEGILGRSERSEVLYNALRAHIMESWGEHGLRFHKKYPWTHTIHSSFHEMGYILPALNRLVRNDPNDKEAEMRSSELVRGMRSLVYERRVRSFWSGDTNESEPLYEFPNDVYVKGRGFDFSHHTGRGEQCIRNAVSMHALVDRYVIAGDEVALDLAIGLANHLLGPSRYFNYKFEFFGHVHSSAWIAAGLIYLGRVTETERYINAGIRIYAYIRSMSSSYGWIPEFAQWRAPELEHCETCCIKDMILCCEELIKCGYSEYWGDLYRFARNQLTENQIKYTGYVVSDDTLPDANGKTFRELGRRLIGGYTGGSEPNSISLTRFRAIAGCCVGTAPIALGIVWNNTVTKENRIYTVNIHTDKETEEWSLTHSLPNEPAVTFTAKRDMDVGFRLYDFMSSPRLRKNGARAETELQDGMLILRDVKAGESVTLEFDMKTIEKKEFFAGREYTEIWRGGDMIDILPHGDHIRLYQRDNEQEKYYPLPEDVEFTGASDRGPTQQSPDK
jgi:hypothetical protein